LIKISAPRNSGTLADLGFAAAAAAEANSALDISMMNLCEFL
jgi:hypothetical protein